MIDRALFALLHIKKVMGALVLLTAIRTVFIVGQCWALAKTIVNLWMGFALSDQVFYLVVFIICFVARQVVIYAQDAQVERYAGRRVEEMRKRLLHTVFLQGPSIVQKQGTGNIATLLIEGINQIENYLVLIVPKIVGVAVIPILLLIVVFPLDWISGLIMLIVFPALIFYMILLGRGAKSAAAAQYQEYQRLSNHFIDSLRGIDTLKLFGQSKAQGSIIFKVSEKFREATIKTLRIATLSGAVLDVFATLSLAGVAIMLGFRLVDGSVSFLSALLVLVLVPEYFKPIREFAGDYHASLEGSNALKALYTLIDTKDRCQVAKEKVPSWTASSSLKLSGITYSYDTFEALHDISFCAHGYMKIGIVGASGSGKTTLIQLLAGFVAPTAGEITMGARKLFDLRTTTWSQIVLYLPQNPYLFHATLRQNILFYRPEASQQDLDQAVSAVGLDALIETLPEGLDTLIGEGARSLSGGQAQRVALARAMLDRSRKILLFDEPTAHLDIETELELKARMLPLMQNRLVIFATHRLHWVAAMDKIVMLEGRRVCEVGTPAQLKARRGAFARFADQVKGGLS